LFALENYQAAPPDLDEVRRACDRVLSAESKHFWAFYLRALAELRNGRCAAAKGSLESCASLKPNFPWQRLLKGYAESELGKQHQLANALASLDDGPKETVLPRSAEAEFAAAETDLAYALKADSKDDALQYKGLVIRGMLRIQQKRWDEAINDLNKAVDRKPKAFQAHLYLAQAFQGQGKLTEAIAEADKAIACGEEAWLSYEFRAQLHRLAGDAGRAEADIKQASELGPQRKQDPSQLRFLENSRIEQGRLLERKGKLKEALAWYTQARDLNPQEPLPHRLRAKVLLELDEYAQAKQALDKYLRLTKDPTASDYALGGLLHAYAREYGDALSNYALALRKDEKRIDILLNRGRTLLLMGAAKAAEDDFEAVLKTKSEHSALALCGRGRVLLRLGFVQKALTDAANVEKSKKVLSKDELFNLACLYSEAANALQAGIEPKLNVRERQDLLEESLLRAARHLIAAIKIAPPEQQLNYWHVHVLNDPALEALRDSRHFEVLAKRLGLPAERPTKQRLEAQPK
jgi:tetratricopeptide (TPR) repeat protein